MPAKLDEIRDQQRETWDKFSGGWGKWEHLVLPMLASVGDEIIRTLRLKPDARHLDIASGTGEPGLTIAQKIPQGRVVLTDLSSGMLEYAKKNADRRGIRNVEVKVCSADSLPFANDTFDSISCRFGFMFFPDIPATTREIARVLKPGGRLSVSVWAEPAGNPWGAMPMAAIGTEIEIPKPSPDVPGLFRCATPGAITSVFKAAGLRDVSETDVKSAISFASPEEYWSFTTEVAAPVVSMLSKVDQAAQNRIKAIVLEKAAGFISDGKVRLPNHARCIAGTK